MPEKLYIIHTADQANYKFEAEAKKLALRIEETYKIQAILVKVDPFDMDQNIKSILQIISAERKVNSSLSKRDFVVNLTGGTKLMVAAAATAAYLAGSRVFYVMDSSKYRGDDIVKELPMPIIPEDNSRGRTGKTTAIVLEKIRKLGRCTNHMLLEELRKDNRVKKNQRIEYHLRKLVENGLVDIQIGWQKAKKNPRTGKPEIDRKKRTITLTPSGEYYAEFPGLLGGLV
jgi:hypothetical protein